MEPMRIEFKLVGPWSPPAFGVHLDGLIAHAVVRDAISSEGAAQPESDRQFADLICDLPFEKHVSQAGWCWKASKLQASGYHGQQRRYLTAKTPAGDLARSIGDGLVDTKGGSVIDMVRGIGKNSALYYTLEHAETLQAWCVGERDALEYLLQQIDAIGVKTRLGHGALQPYPDGKLFSITHDESALVKWKHRNLPDQLVADMYPDVGALHPPYWKNKVYCWMPRDAVNLPGPVPA